MILKKYFNKKFIIIFLIFLLITTALLYFFVFRDSTNKKAETYIVKKSTLKEELNLSGFIDAEEKVDLHFQAGGKLTYIAFKEGDIVQKNQVVATLDQRQLQKNIEKYLNNYSKVRRNFEQTGVDYKDEALSSTLEVRDKARRLLENSQYDLNNSVLDVELQTISKEYSQLRSPITGILTRMDAKSAGVNVTALDIFQIINKDTLYFSLSVDQTEIVQLNEGIKGDILIDAFPDEKFSGNVTFLGFTPKQNETGTVYEVNLALSGKSINKLRIGMTGDVTFTIKEHSNVLTVPTSYIIDEDDDNRYLVVLRNGKQEKRKIITGIEVQNETEVLSGLSEGETIVLVED